MSTMTIENEKLMKKIQKLLNLSTNNPNENEAQNALLFAQKLMAENNISASDLGVLADTPEQKKEVSESVAPKVKLQWYHKAVANIIADNFRCYYFWRTYGGYTRIVFMGLKADAELAKTMYEFALLALDYNADEHVKERRQNEYIRDAKNVRLSYMKGFINGLYLKFKKQVQEQSYALVLVKDDALVEKHKAMKFRKASASTGGRVDHLDGEAFEAGKEKGLKFEAASGYIK